MQGTFQVVAAPDQTQLAAYTQQVVANTYVERSVADDRAAELPNRIQHIVYIMKENRTFDQVYGHRKGVRGDASLAELGAVRDIRNKEGAVPNASISPNHQALADRFSISDNFYCDSDQSNTGHRWCVGVYPNEWVEVNAKSHIEERLFSSAPGRRYVNGSSATVLPEDFNEAGALWEHLDRRNIPFFNFGFGVEMPATIESELEKATGIRMAVGFPIPKALHDRSSRKFPTFNMAIPDQYRVDVFLDELRDRWESGKEPLPRLITLVLPQDHLANPNAKLGYPYRESYMADNDLALGRLIDRLSRSRWWKNMLVVVTEDDSQGGRDHVDAHRSVLLLAGPYVRPGYVTHGLMNFGSIMKLLFKTLGLPSLNQFDATASLPVDWLAPEPNAEPYAMRAMDRRLFDPEKALKPFGRGFDWKAMAESPAMDKPEDMRRELNGRR
jgi:hypothetical protein